MPVMARWALAVRGALVVGVVALGMFLPLTSSRAQEFDSAGGAYIASGGEVVLLREQPGYDAMVLQPLGDGTQLAVIGEPVMASDGSSWLPVAAGDMSGFIPAGYVAGAPVPPETAPVETAAEPIAEPVAEPVAQELGVTDSVLAPAFDPAIPMGFATTSTDTNFRIGPSTDSEVMWTLPPGTTLSINGAGENGFVPVTADGVAGWVAAELLAPGDAATGMLPAPVVADESFVDPAADYLELEQRGRKKNRGGNKDRGNNDNPPPPSSGVSTGIAWPMTSGEWEVVQGYNNGTHTNRSEFAQYKYSLDWARVDGKTAGQPVVAPVSGTVRWVDAGSGGLLIDAGNGYGVALFHVTLQGVSSGSTVHQGQHIGEISGPGGNGFMSMAHIEIAVWQLNGNGHTSVPFEGVNAIGGQEFPDTGGTNQYIGVRVSL